MYRKMKKCIYQENWKRISTIHLVLAVVVFPAVFAQKNQNAAPDTLSLLTTNDVKTRDNTSDNTNQTPLSTNTDVYNTSPSESPSVATQFPQTSSAPTPGTTESKTTINLQPTVRLESSETLMPSTMMMQSTNGMTEKSTGSTQLPKSTTPLATDGLPTLPNKNETETTASLDNTHFTPTSSTHNFETVGAGTGTSQQTLATKEIFSTISSPKETSSPVITFAPTITTQSLESTSTLTTNDLLATDNTNQTPLSTNTDVYNTSPSESPSVATQFPQTSSAPTPGKTESKTTIHLQPTVSQESSETLMPSTMMMQSTNGMTEKSTGSTQVTKSTTPLATDGLPTLPNKNETETTASLDNTHFTPTSSTHNFETVGAGTGTSQQTLATKEIFSTISSPKETSSPVITFAPTISTQSLESTSTLTTNDLLATDNTNQTPLSTNTDVYNTSPSESPSVATQFPQTSSAPTPGKTESKTTIHLQPTVSQESSETLMPSTMMMQSTNGMTEKSTGSTQVTKSTTPLATDGLPTLLNKNEMETTASLDNTHFTPTSSTHNFETVGAGTGTSQQTLATKEIFSTMSSPKETSSPVITFAPTISTQSLESTSTLTTNDLIATDNTNQTPLSTNTDVYNTSPSESPSVATQFPQTSSAPTPGTTESKTTINLQPTVSQESSETKMPLTSIMQSTNGMTEKSTGSTQLPKSTTPLATDGLPTLPNKNETETTASLDNTHFTPTSSTHNFETIGAGTGTSQQTLATKVIFSTMSSPRDTSSPVITFAPTITTQSLESTSTLTTNDLIATDNTNHTPLSTNTDVYNTSPFKTPSVATQFPQTSSAPSHGTTESKTTANLQPTSQESSETLMPSSTMMQSTNGMTEKSTGSTQLPKSTTPLATDGLPTLPNKNETETTASLDNTHFTPTSSTHNFETVGAGTGTSQQTLATKEIFSTISSPKETSSPVITFAPTITTQSLESTSTLTTNDLIATDNTNQTPLSTNTDVYNTSPSESPSVATQFPQTSSAPTPGKTESKTTINLQPTVSQESSETLMPSTMMMQSTNGMTEKSTGSAQVTKSTTPLATDGLPTLPNKIETEITASLDNTHFTPTSSTHNFETVGAGTGTSQQTLATKVIFSTMSSPKETSSPVITFAPTITTQSLESTSTLTTNDLIATDNTNQTPLSTNTDVYNTSPFKTPSLATQFPQTSSAPSPGTHNFETVVASTGTSQETLATKEIFSTKSSPTERSTLVTTFATTTDVMTTDNTIHFSMNSNTDIFSTSLSNTPFVSMKVPQISSALTSVTTESKTTTYLQPSLSQESPPPCTACQCNFGTCFYNLSSGSCQCQCPNLFYGDTCSIGQNDISANFDAETAPARKVNVILEIFVNFEDAFKDLSSTKSLAFISKLEPELEALYKKAAPQAFRSVQIIKLSNGSVVAESVALYNYENNDTQIQFLNTKLDCVLTDILNDTKNLDAISQAFGSDRVLSRELTLQPPPITNILDLNSYVDCSKYANYTLEIIDGKWQCVGPCKADPGYCHQHGDCSNDIHKGPMCKCYKNNFEQYYGPQCEFFRRSSAFYGALFGSLATAILLFTVITFAVILKRRQRMDRW